MATTATITPTLGAAPVTLQAGNYSAVDDRRFWGALVAEGAISGGSYQVIQRAAGANMTVDVASSVGSGAVVQGDSITAQGNYFVPPTTANVNVDIATADATNPRNDLVVLEVKDDQHDAGGLNLARVRVITGTPNGSAVLSDVPGANGTPALPSSCLLLAVVRVAAGATSIVTAAISDRRSTARRDLAVTQMAHWRDEKAAGTDAGGFTSGAWRTRTLNTEKTNNITGASLASNQVTLPAGTYYAEGIVPGYKVDFHRSRLYNITDSADVLLGSSVASGSGDFVGSFSNFTGVFTITAAKVFEVQHRCGTTANSVGFGQAANLDSKTEVYAELKIWRVA